MEEQGHESGEGHGSNPIDSVNAQMVTVLAQMVEILKRQENRAEVSEDANDIALERFQKFSPPKFSGEANVEMAEKWIEAMEDIFDALKYSDERKITFGKFQLEGPAKEWWRVIEEKWGTEGRPRLWSGFLEEFRKKFIPRVVRQRKEEEFIGMKQKALTVSQYEVQFTKLSRYAPDMVNTEENRMKRFLQGLNVDIQRLLVSARMDTYADMVELAQQAEECENKWKNILNDKRSDSKRLENVVESSSRDQAKQVQKGSRKSYRKRPRNPGKEKDAKRGKTQQTCRYCGKYNHKENECWKKVKSCLKCGSPEHLIGKCPMVKGNLKPEPQISA